MTVINKYLLEICCYSASDVLTAWQGGAHQVELCSAYAVGGLTPSLGALQLSKSISKIPVNVMIRPRGGNFTYHALEKELMLKDAQIAIENKAEGIVFGALNADNTVDYNFCKSIKKACANVPLTFHRAIDLCANVNDAIAFLADIGVQSILTSGAEQTALQGIQQIEQFHQLAKGKINIMAGSGVNADNILNFAKIGLTHFHSSASIIETNGIVNDKIAFNAALKNNEQSVVSKQKVEALVQKLNCFF